jgi:Big-like domain-containing protein
MGYTGLGFAGFNWHPHCLVSLLSCVIVACSAGSGDGLDIGGRPLDEGGDEPLAPTLSSLQANLFNPFCTVCHSGASAPLGLRLDAANSFINLVAVSSQQQSSLLRVAPGNPDESYLIRKLEGSASEGEQMPLGGPPIPQATIDFVRQWIVDGALPDSTRPTTPPVVISFLPDPDAVLASLPTDLAVGFDQEIDASTINEATFTLVRSGGDGTFGDGNEIAISPASLSLSALNPRLAIMDLTGVLPAEDRYQVTLFGSDPNRVLGIGAIALDGEYSGRFPSGDGVAGGDFVVEFEIRGIQPTLASIQNTIFTPTCSVSGCHSGPPGSILPAGMDLSSTTASFSSLIDIASEQEPSISRVATGDSSNSYLVDKLEGTAETGSQMPLGGPFLDQATIDVIRRWIDSGAPP